MEWRVFVGVLGLGIAATALTREDTSWLWVGTLIAAFAFGAAA